MEPALNDVIAWAKGAGRILREGYGKDHQINRKGRIDLVTEMDQLAEDYLFEQIRASFPGHTIDSEESGLLAGENQSVWYVDPLDGTTNYAHHLPIFSVSLAYASAGMVQLGVVYDPMRDECFAAERGKGAYINSEPIQVSQTADLLNSLLATGFPYASYTDRRSNLSSFTHFSRITQGVRRLGSAAIDLCYVAAGRVDGYWEQTIRAWDIAAGALIVEEAGGRVSKLNGEPDYLKPPFHILAGNPAVYDLLLQEFKTIE